VIYRSSKNSISEKFDYLGSGTFLLLYCLAMLEIAINMIIIIQNLLEGVSLFVLHQYSLLIEKFLILGLSLASIFGLFLFAEGLSASLEYIARQNENRYSDNEDQI
jgi:hypothetical protein